ncbi:5'-methylthioadenosine/S-adenosylhomocysteine nucleosidase [compost metagenome]
MLNSHVYQELGVIGAFECFLAISEMGTGGTNGSLLSVQKAIGDIKPDTVIMAGIAFGIDKKKFSIGDVLVSQQLLLYDLQRMNSNGTIALRGDTPHASSVPLNWVRHAKLTWPSISNSKVEPGLVLSGDKLIDNIDYRNALRDVAPEALGGEMEGAGLYAACQDAKVDWLLVKAICDWADGNKSKNKSINQKTAAANAARFVVHLLKFSAC